MARIARSGLPILDDILAEHLDDLEHLLRQRKAALRSPDYTLPELRELEGRIVAHVDGLEAGQDRTLALAGERLAGDELDTVIAAGHALLRLGAEPAAALVFETLLGATGAKVWALGEALCLGPIAFFAGGLAGALRTAPPPVAAAAAEALATAGQLDASEPRLAALIEDASPQVRAAAWRSVALAGQPAARAVRRPFEAALDDPDERARAAALAAAAWARSPGLRERCRARVAAPTGESRIALQLLAVLGEPHDLEVFLRAARAPALGPERFALLGSFGHPGVGPELLAGMALGDVVAAAGAASAFTRMTGVDVGTGRRVKVPAAASAEVDPDLLPDLLDDVEVPDVEKAARYWAEVEARYRGSPRWAAGKPLAGGQAHEIAAGLDLQTRWEAHLRAGYDGLWSGNPADLERLV